MVIENLAYNLLGIFIGLLTILVVYYKWCFTYWRRRNVPYLEPFMPFGNCWDLFLEKVNFGTQFEQFYKKFKSMGVKYGGIYMFGRPFFVPLEPELIKNILQKDFQHFVDRGFYVNEKKDPLSGHLFSLEGAKWRDLRVKLTPTFTSGKMKMMFDSIADCSIGIKPILDKAHENNVPVEIKDILACYATDVISSCAFGLESNSLKNPDADFRKYGRRIFENNIWDNIKQLIQFVFPRSLLNIVNFKLTKDDVEDFFMSILKKTIQYRENNNVFRKDFLQLLLQIRNKGKIQDNDKAFEDIYSSTPTMTLEELTAQAYVFFIAGFETSSSTMTFVSLELTQHQDIQEKLRNEIKSVLAKHNNKITYEAIMEMKYMDCVINETLRKYPPVPFLNRLCTKAYNIPGTSIELAVGTGIVIPVLGIHNDPDYYPEPEKFDPDRFTEENKQQRPPMTHIPFGEGPRICIGLRFGLLQTKIGLTVLLNNYKLTLNNKTKLPIEVDTKSFIPTSKHGIWLNIDKVK